MTHIEGILPKGPYLSCISMAGRALLQDTLDIWVINLTIIGSDNGLSPDRHQAIIWTNAVILLLIRTLGTNFSEIISEIHTFSFKKIHLKMSSAKWRSFHLNLNVLNLITLTSVPCHRRWASLTSATFYQDHLHQLGSRTTPDFAISG